MASTISGKRSAQSQPDPTRGPPGHHPITVVLDLVRKATLASLLRRSRPGIRLNEHLTEPGDMVFRHACKMGLEGIVSKRIGSRYRSGRSPDWIKSKNSAAPGGAPRGGRGLGTMTRRSSVTPSMASP
jgi:hypothetical protein